MRLRTKLLTYFVVLILFGIALSGYITFNTMYGSAVNNFSELMKKTTKAVKNNRIQAINDIEVAVANLSHSKAVKKFMNIKSPSIEDIDNIKEFISINIFNLTGTETISILNADGVVVVSSDNSLLGINFSDESYVEQAIKNEQSIDIPYSPAHSDNRSIKVAHSVNLNNKVTGLIVASINISTLSKLTFKNLTMKDGEWIFVTDNKGRIINCAEAKTHDDFLLEAIGNISDVKGLRDVTINGKNGIAYYEMINDNSYAFMVIYEYIVENAIIEARNKLIIIGLFVFVVVVLISYLFVGKAIDTLEQALEHESSLLKTIIDSIPDLLFYKNLDGVYQGCNMPFSKFIGTDEKNIVGKTDYEVFKLNAELVMEFIKRDKIAVDKGDFSINEEWVKYPDLSDHLFETIKTPFSDSNGKVKGLLGISRDITLRYSQEQLIEKAKADAIEANKSKSEFLARMSHEIRTPLNGIIGMNELALLAAPNAEMKNFLIKIAISANNLLAIVNDILDFSKIEAGKMVIEQTPFKLEDILTYINDGIGQKISAKKINFVCDIDNNIPKTLIGDPLRVTQILLNLLSNAVKFTENGTITLSISTVNEDSESINLLFKVKDTGIGITENHLKRLFTSFTQADGSISRKYGGTGLGLSISKLLVELMGGTISANSTVGKGSTFLFEVKFKKNSSENIVINRKININQVIDDEQILVNKKVLLVEDNEINQEIALLLLKKLKIEADLAEDGVSAVEATEKADYDLILMDIQMPNMDGYEATNIIRGKGYNKPIIAMTANAMSQDRQAAFEAGMDDHLPKPFRMENFKAILIHWLKEDSKRSK